LKHVRLWQKLTIDLVEPVHVGNLHFEEVHKIRRIEELVVVESNLRFVGMEKPVGDMASLHTVGLDLVSHHTEEGVERRNLPELVSLRTEVVGEGSCCNRS
jgi:protein gp37